MQNIKAVIWDLDGTLLNTLDDLAAAVNAALDAYGMPARTVDEVRRFVGNGVRMLIRRAVPRECNEQTVDEVLASFRSYYAAHHTDRTTPYDGIIDTLDRLQAAGILSLVVSNKIEPEVIALCERFFQNRIAAAIGDAPPRPPKPAPDGVLLALKKLNISADQTVFVGDMTVDIDTARGLDIPCLAAGWGFSEPAALHAYGAAVVLDHPSQVADYVLKGE
jgi:phosphoglycolate phosphatase